MNTLSFSWKKIKSYRDGSATDIQEAIKIWCEENVAPILDSYINEMRITGSEVANYYSNVELKTRKDLSFETEDKKLLSIIKGLREATDCIRKHNLRSWSRIITLYSCKGIVKVSDINKIFIECIEDSNLFFYKSDNETEAKLVEYLDVIKLFFSYIFALRLWIYRVSEKFKLFLDFESNGILANNVYKILEFTFNTTVYGHHTDLDKLVANRGASTLYKKLKATREDERIKLIEVDPYAEEDEFIKTGGDNESIISNNPNKITTEINEKFYYYTTSLSKDDFKAKVLYYYNTYKGSSNLIPIMGEFGSIEFVNLIMLIDYFKSLIDKESNNIDAREFYKDLNLKCLITMGFAFNHMTPGEFSDELDKIVKPYPGIMEYSEWSKVYRYLRDNYGNWIHNQEFAYGTPELRDDPLKYNKHYVLFADAYNQMSDYQSAIRFYKRQGLKPDFCSSYFPLNMILNS